MKQRWLAINGLPPIELRPRRPGESHRPCPLRQARPRLSPEAEGHVRYVRRLFRVWVHETEATWVKPSGYGRDLNVAHKRPRRRHRPHIWEAWNEPNTVPA